MFALVVTCQAATGELIRQSLGAEGWWVTAVADRETAVRSASEQAPQLVVVDGEVDEAGELVRFFSSHHGGPGVVLLAPDDAGAAGAASQREADEVLGPAPDGAALTAAAARLLDHPQPTADDGLPTPGQVLNAQDIFGDMLLEMEASSGLAEPPPPPEPQPEGELESVIVEEPAILGKPQAPVGEEPGSPPRAVVTELGDPEKRMAAEEPILEEPEIAAAVEASIGDGEEAPAVQAPVFEGAEIPAVEAPMFGEPEAAAVAEAPFFEESVPATVAEAPMFQEPEPVAAEEPTAEGMVVPAIEVPLFGAAEIAAAEAPMSEPAEIPAAMAAPVCEQPAAPEELEGGLASAVETRPMLIPPPSADALSEVPGHRYREEPHPAAPDPEEPGSQPWATLEGAEIGASATGEGEGMGEIEFEHSVLELPVAIDEPPTIFEAVGNDPELPTEGEMDESASGAERPASEEREVGEGSESIGERLAALTRTSGVRRTGVAAPSPASSGTPPEVTASTPRQPATGSSPPAVPLWQRVSLPGGGRFWLGMAAGLLVYVAASFLLERSLPPSPVDEPVAVSAPVIDPAGLQELVDQEMAEREAALRESLLEEERRLQQQLEEIRSGNGE